MFEVSSQHCWCEEVTTISALVVSDPFVDLNDQIRMTTVTRWEKEKEKGGGSEKSEKGRFQAGPYMADLRFIEQCFFA